MTEHWFAPHAAGFGPLVARLAARDIPGFSLEQSEDNALLFSSRAEPRALLSYCRGLFRLIGRAPGGLQRAARALLRDPAVPGRLASARGPRSFVLRSFEPDDPASLPLELRRELESMIARATGLRPDSARPDREYRVQERADGMTLFLERMTSPPEGPTRPGELPRSTCRLLAEMTEPRPDDVFLDPFCGYGGIALERALAAPYRFVFATDLDGARTAAVKVSLAGKAFEKRRKTIFPKTRDALEPSVYEAGFIGAIATDPPWGLFEGGLGGVEAETLLRSFIAEAARLLAPGGRLVLLLARGARLETGEDFSLRESLDVLVSGKKARALRLDRV
jgi:SAM-dependent methyltransferase